MSQPLTNRLRGERVNPCLLDKLSDEESIFQTGNAVLSLQVYVETVVRDLKNLLNTKTQTPLRPLNSNHLSNSSLHVPSEQGQWQEDFPEAARSTITYGLPDLRGRHLSSLDPVFIERMIEDTIKFFEPRINQNTLRVQAVHREHKDSEPFTQAILHFRITGELWAFPKPEWLDLNTSVNVDTGEVEISK